MTPWPVARWHSHPNEKLRNSGDDTFAHGKRCLELAWRLLDDVSDELCAACVQHDYGECVTGDLPYSIKRAHPELRAMVSLLETQALASFGIKPWKLTDDECRMLKLVDLLDPYLWVIHCDAIEEFAKDEWQQHLDDMFALADHLGVRARVLEIINEAEERG
jgi:5'-deoxynucleotidase YfbR-like HD superfamily hydrolase